MNQRDVTLMRSYLERYAETEAAWAADISGQWSHVVCIPACNEEPGFLRTLASLRRAAEGHSPLVLVIVNGTKDASEQVHQSNASFLSLLRGQCGLTDAPWALGSDQGLAVLCVDRSSGERRLPAGQGVGLARKIVGDLALALIVESKVESPWMLCTDADVEVPLDYFGALPAPQKSPLSALIYPFEHVLEGGTEQRAAMRQYERYLHYYVLGLRAAGSPYAYHAIGSLLGIHARAYAAVRGFPRRQAGEDFYILNKLVKTAPVLPLCAGRLQVRGRWSDRVPFGTGAAIAQIHRDQKQGVAYSVYDPRTFAVLRRWNQALRSFALDRNAEVLRETLEPEGVLPAGVLWETVKEQGAVKAAVIASEQTRTEAALLRRLWEWNDAFRTLKLVHALRDRALPEMRLKAAIEAAPFVGDAMTGESDREGVHLRDLAESGQSQAVGPSALGWSVDPG